MTKINFILSYACFEICIFFSAFIILLKNEKSHVKYTLSWCDDMACTFGKLLQFILLVIGKRFCCGCLIAFGVVGGPPPDVWRKVINSKV